MQKLLSIPILLLFAAVSFAQDLDIPNNPYDLAPDEIKNRNSFKRERWFYEQRMFPNNFIPQDAYKNAYEQRENLRQSQGFYNDNVNSWVSLGPTSGFYFNYGNISSRITTIIINPSNPNIVYLGAAYGGVWKSTDAGNTWTSKTFNESSLSSGALELDPNNPNIVYYGTGEATYSGASYYGRGLLKSTNGGDTWTNYTTGLPSLTYTSRIVVRPGNSNQVFAAMGTAGLYKSLDGGVTWSVVASGRCDDILFSPGGDTAYAIGSGVGYIVSTNGGSSFSPVAAGFTVGTRNHIALCRTQPNVMYMSRYSGSSITVYKSTNAGYNYTQISVGTNFSGSQAWYDFYMYVNPFDPNYAYVGSIDIWRTTNGNTFTNITNGYNGGNVHVDQQNMTFHPTDPDKMYCTNDGGVWMSTNRGTNWTNLNSTLTLTQFYRIASNPSNSNEIMGGTQDNGTQRTTGAVNWIGAFGGDGGDVVYQSQNNNHILGETQNNGVQRSVNGGNSWSSATSGLTGSGAWVGPLLTHPDSAGYFYTARGQVFKTTNIAATWVPISSGTSGTIREMAICRSNPAVMYATSGAQVFRSTNRGYNFSNVTVGLPNRTITSVGIHPDSSNVAIVTFSGFGGGKIYKTTNNGATWNNVSGNLPDSPVNDGLIYYPGSSTSTMFVAMDIGVFMTNDWGTSWIELADGLPNTVAMHLDYHDATNKLRIGTHGRGVYELDMLVSVNNVSSSVPDSYELFQNYPNPFNPSTNIKFAVPKNGMVKLVVMDMLGREVKELINSNLSAGTYEVSYTVKNAASGIYFYRLETPGFTETKKMIIVK
jgi:photosystem II stability/assembly factor-like uncharacterized protein